METLKSCPFEEPVGEYEIENNKTMQTNEEWFCGLSTEEKAKWIAYQIYYAAKCDVYSENRKDWSSKDWEMWLKQPHRKENKK